MKSIEKEYKEVITREKYDQLLELFEWDNEVQQVNYYYFDEKNLVVDKGITVRVRQINDKLILQIKTPVDVKGSLHIKKEFEKEINHLDKYISGHGIAELSALNIGKLECKGQLFTIRNIFAAGKTMICLDKNMYLGKVDYEVEVEYQDKIDDSIINTFKEIGVSFIKETQGKNTRFHNEYLNNWRV